MKKERRKFDKEFKIMTVELCLSGKSTTEVAEELGLRTELVSRWKREYQLRKEGRRGAIVFPDMGNQRCHQSRQRSPGLKSNYEKQR